MKSCWKRVCIIGVGLIGGSLGLALRQRGLAERTVGVGRRRESLDAARAAGVVDEVTLELAAGVAEADLIVVCTPVGLIASQVEEAARHCLPEALITDAGSTKQTIVDALEARLPTAVRFVGSHPLAGSEKAGPQWARADLFAERTVVVTPTAATPEADLAETEALWKGVGARVLRLPPQTHDLLLAEASHTPHVVAAALAAATSAEALPLTATGWRDTTRIAAGESQLWQQILAANRAHVLRSLDNFAKVLASFQEALQTGDQDRLLELLEQGKRNRDAVGN